MTESTTLWDGTPLLPPIGSLVLIEHGRDDMDHVCVVTGYEVALPAGGRMHEHQHYHRVFVNLKYRGTGTANQRLLDDIKPLTKARSIAQDRNESGDAP